MTTTAILQVPEASAAVTGHAFQDQIPANFCYGCGPGNPVGLHIRSIWAGDEALCVFQPAPYHAAGPRHILNGGIIATLIDCATPSAPPSPTRTAPRAVPSVPPPRSGTQRRPWRSVISGRHRLTDWWLCGPGWWK
jgi:hypothetical protein